jgi:hypothetical protein
MKKLRYQNHIRKNGREWTWNRLIHGEDIERVYSDRDKAQVTQSLKFLANNAYITVDYNEKEDVVGIQMHSRQLDENVLGNILKHIHT